MSEPENQPTPPSTSKTSAVPLKKETVRITLRARPGAGTTQPREATSPVNPVTSGVPTISPKRATAPIQLPSAPLPPPAAKSATAPVKLPPAPMDPSRKTTSAVPVAASPVPSAPSSATPVPPPGRPAAPAATVPMAPPRPPGVPVPPTAPGVPRPPAAPMAPRPVAPSAPGARVETGATTAPLSKPAPRPPGGAGTAPMGSAAPTSGTAALPKATVKLQQTQPMARPSVSAPPSAPVKRTAAADSQQFYEEKDPEDGLLVPAVLCFILSAVLMGIQMLGSDRVTSNADSPIMVPPAAPAKWEKHEQGKWVNNFDKSMPTVQ